jgi:oxygen-independent coproporphyrinogen-3 oxidase
MFTGVSGPDSKLVRLLELPEMLARLEPLLARYDRAVPRYTSYPTAPVWGEAYGPADFAADLASAAQARRLALYVHVPFCASLCHFCACNRVITRSADPPARYLDAIAREVEIVRAALGDPPPASQLHWGGGTPTHLTPEQVGRLHGLVTDAFPLAPDAEVSIEVDPRVTSDAHLETLRARGFNRISLGVQDFDPRVQAAIHRVQSPEQTRHVVERSRALGFASVSFDLIYGLPHQSETSFDATLDSVLALAPDRIALYGYAHVTWVARQQRGFERHDLPDPPTRIRILLRASARLLEAGYRFIGLDHFALPDDELVIASRDGTLRRNFMGHTTQAGVELIGFGPSAISEFAASYAQSTRELAGWHEALAKGSVATMRGIRLSPQDVERRWLIWQLICTGGVGAHAFFDTFGATLSEHYATELARFDPAIEDGLIERAPDGSLRVTMLGRFLIRNLAAVFDAYLPIDPEPGQQMFSRAV